MKKTSCAWSYLLKKVVEFFVGWIGSEPEPRERVVFVVAEDVAERSGSVPAVWLRLVVRDHGQVSPRPCRWVQGQVSPAVFDGDRLEHSSDDRPRPSNTHRRVVFGRIIEHRVAAELREERTLPVRQQVPGRYTHCVYTFTSSASGCNSVY